MLDRVHNQLREYPKLRGYSRRTVLANLAKIDWTLDDSLDTAASSLKSTAKDTIRSWGTLAKSMDRPLEQVVRNLVACSRKDDLPIYLEFLRHWHDTDPDSEEWVKSVWRFLDQTVQKDRLVSKLLKQKQLTKHDFLSSLPTFPDVVVLASTFQFFAKKSATKDLPRDILSVVRLTRTTDTKALDHLFNALCSIVEELQIPELISSHSFGRMPRHIRIALLASPAQLACLSPSLSEQLSTNPWFHRDAPANTSGSKLVEAAAQAIASGAFHRKSLSVLCLDKTLFETHRHKLGGVLSLPRKLDRHHNGLSHDQIRSLYDLSHLPEASALLLLDSCLSRNKPPINFLQIRTSVPSILRLFSDEAIAHLLTQKSAGHILSEAVNHLTDSRIAGIVDSWISGGRALHNIPLSMFDRWFRERSVKRICQLAKACESLLARLVGSYPDSEKLFEVLASDRSRRIDGSVANLVFSKSFLSWLDDKPLSSNETQLVYDSASLLRSSADSRWTRTTLKRALSAAPRQIAKLVRPNARPWEIKTIVQYALRANPIDEKNLLLRHRKSQRFWVVYLRLEKHHLTRIPKPFRLWIESDPRRLSEAIRVVPHLFWRTIYQTGRTEKLLPYALKDRLVAKASASAISVHEWRTVIPHVHKRYANAPWIGAAYELALAFSPVHAGFLVRALKQISIRNTEALGTRLDHWYYTYKLPKDSGGSRTITVPPGPLKAFQRRVLEFGLNTVPLHSAAMGFRANISIKDNAHAHCRKKVILNVDVQSCFPSVGFKQIHKAFRHLGEGWLSDRAIFLLAQLCSYQGGLPTGAPSSPAILNIVFRTADQAIHNVASRRGLTYTRYADDLTFSGDRSPQSILPMVTDVLGDLGLRLDEKKTHFYRKGRRQMVTGLVVNDKPNVPRYLRRRLRALVHHRVNGRQPLWHGRPISDNRIRGYLAYLHQFQPEEAMSLRRQLDSSLLAEQ